MEKEKLMSSVALAIEIIEKELKRKNEDVSRKANFALRLLSLYQKLISAENSRLSLYRRMVHDISMNQEELKKYIELTMPSIRVLKAEEVK